MSAARLHRHLARCPECASWFAAASEATTLVRSTRAAAAPELHLSALRRRAVRTSGAAGAVAAAAALALVLLPRWQLGPARAFGAAGLSPQAAWVQAHEVLRVASRSQTVVSAPPHVSPSSQL